MPKDQNNTVQEIVESAIAIVINNSTPSNDQKNAVRALRRELPIEVQEAFTAEMEARDNKIRERMGHPDDPKTAYVAGYDDALMWVLSLTNKEK